MRLPIVRRASTAWALAIVTCVAAFTGGVLASKDDRGGRDPRASASYLGFGVGNWPNAAWRPYAASSPFNTPITTGARVHPQSDRYVRRILEFGQPAPIVAGTGGTEEDYAHPTYYARSSDPKYVMQPQYRWGGPGLRGRTIHIPAAARAATGTDGHMTVVQPDGWEYDFWRVTSKPRGGGVLRFAIGSRVRVRGSGLGARATAAGFATLAGIVRPPEFEAGRIDHALFIVLTCLDRSRHFGYGTRLPPDEVDSAYVYPAEGGGSVCQGGDRFVPPMGARLQLAMTPEQIDALGLPAWKTGILRALAAYGGYVGDTGGPGFAIKTESSLTYTSYGRPDPLLAFGRAAVESGDPAVEEYQGQYVFDLASGVDWQRYLRVLAPQSR